MKRIATLINEIECLQLTISNHFNQLQETTGLKCLRSCGKCCNYNDIKCSVLEVLPLAFYIKTNNLFELEKLILENPNQKICHLFQALTVDGKKGFCGQYHYRPSICRMFGVYAFKNKFNEFKLGSCDIIKNEYEINESEIVLDFESTMSYWTNLIENIDPYLASDINHINLSIYKALDLIDRHLYFQDTESNDNLISL